METRKRDKSLRFGVRGHDFDAAGFTELSIKCAETGVENIQLAIKKSFPDFRKGLFTPAYARKMKSILDMNNIHVSVLGAYIRSVHFDVENRFNELDYFIEQLKYAKFMDADMVGLETTFVGEDNSRSRNQTENAYRFCLESLGILVEAAEKLGVMIGIEGVEQHIINTPEKMARLVNDLASPNVGVIFDPVNYISASNYTKQADMMKEQFELLGDLTYAVHIKDFNISDNQMHTLLAGDGIFDFDTLFSLVKQYKREIPMIFEGVNEAEYHIRSAKLREIYDRA
ncbi:MAG: sugar phosphate isomerase/epimerase [Clostridia bacterium]|nr:sugar phosphate isomerase/epimerase [Clostridia bacterium]